MFIWPMRLYEDIELLYKKYLYYLQHAFTYINSFESHCGFIGEIWAACLYFMYEEIEVLESKVH